MRAWVVGAVLVAAVVTATVLSRCPQDAAPRDAELARGRTDGSAALPETRVRIERRPARLAVAGAAAAPRAPRDRDAWFDARAAGFERAQRDALEAVALDDAELQVLLAAAAKERAGADAVAAAALESIRTGATPPDTLDVSGVERPLEALLGDRYSTYVLIRLRATLEEFDAVDQGCVGAGCE